MSRPKLLDLYCGEGGCSVGYERAGFDVTGVDIHPKHRYPLLNLTQGDALAVLEDRDFIAGFDVIAGSPPCQRWSLAQRIMDYEHPDLVEPTRALMIASGKPYVIENVEGAPLIDPVMLCGAMFPGLRVYRHRLFESNVELTAPGHPAHVAPLTKMGRAPVDGEFMHIVGNFIGVAEGRMAMGAPWMTRDGLRESIPPAYTEWIGRQLIDHLERRVAA